MKLALNGATTMRADLATDLLAAQSAGYDYLEIWAAKLRTFLKENSIADLQALFNSEYWVLSSRSRTSGAGFVLKQTLSDANRELEGTNHN